MMMAAVRIARARTGRDKIAVCGYHGWAFDPNGRIVDIKDHAAAGYPPAFDAANHDLVPIAREGSIDDDLLEDSVRRIEAALRSVAGLKSRPTGAIVAGLGVAGDHGAKV